MTGNAFRFLHAADFQLHQPIRGLTEIPDHLEASLRAAPLDSVRRVFETAILEEVDFVLLSGNLVDPRTASPRALAHLMDQFALLADSDLTVYWCRGPCDADAHWPDGLQWPDNVHCFSTERVDEFSHFRDDTCLATIMGRSDDGRELIRAEQFRVQAGDPFTIAVAHGRAATADLQARRINYWALGGYPNRKTLCTAPCTAHYPGWPQGRISRHRGPHGCTLVHVDNEGRIRTQPVATDSIRWQTEELSVAGVRSADDVLQCLEQRAQQLLSTLDRTHLVSWRLRDAEPFRDYQQLRQSWIDHLQSVFGMGSAAPALWTVDLDWSWNLQSLQSAQQEDTILGEFLRTLPGLNQDADASLELSDYLPDAKAHAPLAQLASMAMDRQGILDEAAVLAAALLRGDLTIEALLSDAALAGTRNENPTH